MAKLQLLCFALGVALGLSACRGEGRRAGGIALSGSGASGGGFSPDVGGGPCVADGVCGNEVHQIALDVPNLYFVLDRSGSMQELVSGKSRYEHVRLASLELVRSLGPLINVGAALFPHGNIDDNPCTDGAQVLPVSPGDPIDGDGVDGATTAAFALTTNVTPKGGTPIAATLENLYDELVAQSGRTFALLLTDGGPNCNLEASCSVRECMPFIEQDPNCPATDNCCAEGHAYAGPSMCLDRVPTVTAVQALADAGITVYVVGIPGSEAYASVLDEMAIAGGAPQTSGPTNYHRVDDLAALGTVFSELAAAAISCTVALSDPPADKGYTNVYFDCETVPYDPVDGWEWAGDAAVVLRGAACNKLKMGQVAQVKVASGCPTELPK